MVHRLCPVVRGSSRRSPSRRRDSTSTQSANSLRPSRCEPATGDHSTAWALQECSFHPFCTIPRCPRLNTCICPRLRRANAHIAVAQTIPRTLAENAGYKADEVMAALYAAHENGDKNVGSPAAPRRLCSTLNTIAGLDFPLRVTGYQTRGCVLWGTRLGGVERTLDGTRLRGAVPCHSAQRVSERRCNRRARPMSPATVGGAGVDISGDLVASGNVIDAASVGIYDHLEGKKCVQCFR